MREATKINDYFYGDKTVSNIALNRNFYVFQVDTYIVTKKWCVAVLNNVLYAERSLRFRIFAL